MTLADVLTGKQTWDDVFVILYGNLQEYAGLLLEDRAWVALIVEFARDLGQPVKERLKSGRRGHTSHRLRCAAFVLDYIGFEVAIGVTTTQEVDMMEGWVRAETIRSIPVFRIGEAVQTRPSAWTNWLMIYLALSLNCSEAVISAVSAPLRYWTRIVIVDDYHGWDRGQMRALLQSNRVFLSQQAGRQLLGALALTAWTEL
jgi:hypothetical protein